MITLNVIGKSLLLPLNRDAVQSVTPAQWHMKRDGTKDARHTSPRKKRKRRRRKKRNKLFTRQQVSRLESK